MVDKALHPGEVGVSLVLIEMLTYANIADMPTHLGEKGVDLFFLFFGFLFYMLRQGQLPQPTPFAWAW